MHALSTPHWFPRSRQFPSDKQLKLSSEHRHLSSWIQRIEAFREEFHSKLISRQGNKEVDVGTESIFDGQESKWGRWNTVLSPFVFARVTHIIFSARPRYESLWWLTCESSQLHYYIRTQHYHFGDCQQHLSSSKSWQGRSWRESSCIQW